MREAACCSSPATVARVDASCPARSVSHARSRRSPVRRRGRSHTRACRDPAASADPDPADDLADGPRRVDFGGNERLGADFLRARQNRVALSRLERAVRAAAAKRQPQHAQHVGLHRGRRAGCRGRPTAAAAAESPSRRRHVWRHRRRHHRPTRQAAAASPCTGGRAGLRGVRHRRSARRPARVSHSPQATPATVSSVLAFKNDDCPPPPGN